MLWAGVPRWWEKNTLDAQSSRVCSLLLNVSGVVHGPHPNTIHMCSNPKAAVGGFCLHRVSMQCLIFPVSFIQTLWKPKETHSKWPFFPEGSASLQVLRDGAMCISLWLAVRHRPTWKARNHTAALWWTHAHSALVQQPLVKVHYSVE